MFGNTFVSDGFNRNVIIKGSNSNKANDTTLAIDGQLQIQYTAGTYSGVVVSFWNAANATMDLKLTLQASVGSGRYGSQSLFDGVAVGVAPPATLLLNTVSAFGTPANNFFGITLEFFFIANGGGVFGLYWAQNTLNAGILQLMAGSRMEIYKRG